MPAVVEGITPAGAGKTGVARRIQCRLQDHPRRCGENCKYLSIGFFVLGSPPQVRGKRYSVKKGEKAVRITPAGAGKTNRFDNNILYIKDHPRRCGENRSYKYLQIQDSGSPPQVRGKRFGTHISDIF